MPMCIPDIVSDEEFLARLFFHHFTYSRSKNKVKTNIFQPPVDRNDVSVNRFDYSSHDRCVDQGEKMALTNGGEFSGYIKFKVFNIKNIEGLNVEVLSEPLEDTPEHANIIYTDINISLGIPLPPDFRKHITKFLDNKDNYEMLLV